MSEHLDLDRLADVLAGEPAPGHLAGCASCSAALDDLRGALGAVEADLAALAAAPLPDAPDRPGAAPHPAASTTVLPVTALADAPRRRRWVAPAGGIAAAAVLVTGAGLLLNSNATDSGDSATSAEAARTYAVSDSGTDYTTEASLTRALPGLLQGGTARTLGTGGDSKDSAVTSSSSGGPAAPQAADALARLRTPTGLASCLASLTDPSDEGLPLALDYARYRGKPALVVVLPSTKPSKVDVWVVGAGCAQQESDLLVYVKADRPAP